MKYVIEIITKGYLVLCGQKMAIVTQNPEKAKIFIYSDEVEKETKDLNSKFSIIPLQIAIENERRKKKIAKKPSKSLRRKFN